MRLGIFVGLALMVLAAGCGKQDLYDPPGSPYRITGRLELPSTGEAVVMEGDWAYVAGGEAGLVTVDISDRNSPRLVGMVNTEKHASDIQVVRTLFMNERRDIAYITDGTEGLVYFDVTDPAQPLRRPGSMQTYFATNLVATEPENLQTSFMLFIPDGWHGLVWAEVTPEEPEGRVILGGDHLTLGEAYGIAVRDGWGYVADNHMGLVVMDLHVVSEDAVDVVAWADTPGAARAVELYGDYAFVADGTEGLAVFRIDGGNTPVPVFNFDLSGYSEDLALRDGLLAIASNLGGVHFFDVTSPATPVYLGSVATPYALGVCFGDDGTCLVADQEDGLLVLTGRGAFRDETPPAAIGSLTTEARSASTIRLNWIATGDDRLWGQAAAQEIRYAITPIVDEATWAAATPIAEPPAVGESGAAMIHDVDGLNAATEYHFAIRLRDDAGNVSRLSNAAQAATLTGISLLDASLDITVGTGEQTFTYEVTCSYGDALTSHDVVIDDQPFEMTNVAPTGVGDDGVYRYSTQLPVGRHTYSFRFAAEGVPAAQTPAADGPAVGRVIFRMGSPIGELGREADEVPHDVALGYEIEAKETEVTQAQWDAVMPAGSNPSQRIGANLPVDSVTWVEACRYANALSAHDGYTPSYTITGDQVTWSDRLANGWRLPTEAEWEYLCRAGAATSLSGGDLTEMYCRLDPVLDPAGWYCANAGSGPHDVGGKAANAWGYRDMHGNVREWCWDWYGPLTAETVFEPVGPDTGVQRLCRGGSWYYASQDCRSAARGKFPPDSRDDTVGLRVVRTVER